MTQVIPQVYSLGGCAIAFVVPVERKFTKVVNKVHHGVMADSTTTPKVNPRMNDSDFCCTPSLRSFLEMQEIYDNIRYGKTTTIG